MQNSGGQNRRRTVVVHKALQYRIVGAAVFLFSVSALLVWGDLHSHLAGLSRRGVIGDPNLIELLNNISLLILFKMVFILAAVSILSLVASHYIAGPIYHIEKSLEVVKGGDLTERVRLRKHDQFMHLAQSFNEAVINLQSLVHADREKAHSLGERLEILAQNLGGNGSSEARAIAEEIRKLSKGFTA